MKILRIKTELFLMFLIGFLLIESSNAAEDQSSPKITTIESENTNHFTLSYSTPIDELSQNTIADNILWVNAISNKHLVLWHRGKGRKERGNVLLLHAQGENAEHFRLIHPLTKQLTKLGWNIFIPNIAQEDFPKLLVGTQNKDKTNNNDVSNTTLPDQSNILQQDSNDEMRASIDTGEFFFKNAQEYQNYFSSLYQGIFEQTDITKLPTVIIANQNSAYWSLKCLDNKRLTPIIFLQPQLPIGVSNNLAETFAQQTNPLFSFHPVSTNTDIFNTMYKKRLWRSKFQRFNTGMLSSSKLQDEDNIVAKTITGWVEKQRKK